MVALIVAPGSLSSILSPPKCYDTFFGEINKAGQVVGVRVDICCVPGL